MRLIRLKFAVATLTACVLSCQTADIAQRLSVRALGATPMLGDLRELCDHIGGRPTGSPASERAIDWAAAKFKAIGVDAVATEPFTVPNRWAAVSAEAGVWCPWSSHSAWRPRPAPRPHRAP
jgi:hypothetical protein